MGESWYQQNQKREEETGDLSTKFNIYESSRTSYLNGLTFPKRKSAVKVLADALSLMAFQPVSQTEIVNKS